MASSTALQRKSLPKGLKRRVQDSHKPANFANWCGRQGACIEAASSPTKTVLGHGDDNRMEKEAKQQYYSTQLLWSWWGFCLIRPSKLLGQQCDYEYRAPRSNEDFLFFLKASAGVLRCPAFVPNV